MLLEDSLRGVSVVRGLDGPIVDVGSGGGAPGMFNIPEIGNLGAKRKLLLREVRAVGEDLRVSALVENGDRIV